MNDKQQRFIQLLAKYLVGDQARMSIKLSMSDPAAVAWAELRSATPITGWPTIEEAEKTLTEWLTPDEIMELLTRADDILSYYNSGQFEHHDRRRWLADYARIAAQPEKAAPDAE